MADMLHKKRGRGRFFLFFLPLLFLLPFALLTAWAAPYNSRATRRVLVQVPPGSSAAAIADFLAKRHLIRSAFYFRLLVRLEGAGGGLKAGSYWVRPADTPQQILSRMVSGVVAATRLVIPEGFTVRQFLDRLAEQHLASVPAMEAALRRLPPPLPPATGVRDPWEGYLFPATYNIPVGAKPEVIAQTFARAFRHRALPLLKGSATLSAVQVLTLASIIQQEGKTPAQFALISGVFANRLHLHMRLQSDATVHYTLGSDRLPITGADLQNPSPYNTYVHGGLPPGPICNPGLAAIQAALHPAKVGYLFFVYVPGKGFVFNNTYAGHQKALASP